MMRPRPSIRGLLLPTIIGTLALGSCGGDDASDSGSAKSTGGGGGATGAAPRVMNTLPRFRLRDQGDAQFGTKELADKVWIATFVFTRCKATCPQQTAELVGLQERLASHAKRADIHFVSITVDPEHDTPAVLARYAEKAGCDLSQWSYLTGKRDEIWELSKDGFKLPVAEAKDDPETLITHSQSMILVDRARRVRGHYDALDADARATLLRDLDHVLTDPPGPTLAPKHAPEDDTGSNKFYQPLEVEKTAWMKPRAEAQRATLPHFEVFHEFGFTDRLPDSGITFMNRVVADAAKFYKGVHYDHGNGVVVADVDGDGLYDIYFVNQLGANQLCRNLGGGKFEDITAAAGVAVADRIGVTASFADTDNDGDADLYVTTVRGGNLLFENDGKGKFTDISEASGLAYNGHSSSAVFFDYDRDGLLDLFLTNPGKYTTEVVGPDGYLMGYADGFEGHLKGREEQSYLYRNTGGNKFVDASQATGLVDMSWTGAASPIDLNEDGWPDLYVLSMQGHDEYYENVEGKRFVKKSRAIFPRTPWGAMGIKVFDFDNDGRMDIYVTDMHTDMVDDFVEGRRFWYAEKLKMSDMFPTRFLGTDGNHVRGNAFFHNQGGGRFREISDRIGAENYWPWGLSVGDLNSDGFVDAFVTSSMNFPFRYGVNSLLLNNRGQEFLDSEFILGVEPRRDGRLAKLWFDLDADGVDKPHVYSKGRKGRVEVWGALGTRSSVIFDLDADGDLDIVTNDFNSEPMVLISDLTEKKPDIRYLIVDLAGTKSNRDGIGARVRVFAGTNVYTKVQDGQSGYLSQSVYPLYFGLGESGKVDKIEVEWPSSGTQVVPGPIETNRTHTVTEKQ